MVCASIGIETDHPGHTRMMPEGPASLTNVPLNGKILPGATAGQSDNLKLG